MYKNRRNAFTMIELIFVIAVIGILAAVAVPRFAATRDDAVISKARSTVAAMRSAITTERQKRILRGEHNATYNITASWVETNSTVSNNLGSGWSVSGNNFVFTGAGGSCTFTLSGNKLTKSTCSVPNMNDL